MAAVLDELLGGRIAAGAVVVKRGQARPAAAHRGAGGSAPGAGRGQPGRRPASARDSPRPPVRTTSSSPSSPAGARPSRWCRQRGSRSPTRSRSTVCCSRAGADIVSVNRVRKHLSRLKGGRLARAAGCEVAQLHGLRRRRRPAGRRHRPDRAGLVDLRRRPGRLRPVGAVAAPAHARGRPPAARRPGRGELPQPRPRDVVRRRRRAHDVRRRGARRRRSSGTGREVLRLDLEGESAEAGALVRPPERRPPRPGTALVAGGEATTTLARGAGALGRRRPEPGGRPRGRRGARAPRRRRRRPSACCAWTRTAPTGPGTPPAAWSTTSARRRWPPPGSTRGPPSRRTPPARRSRPPATGSSPARRAPTSTT